MSFLSYSSNFHGVVDVFMHAPERYLPFARLMAGIMNDESDLSKPQREMIALHVSALNDCHYCVGSHRAVLAGLGIGEDMIAAAEAGAISCARTDPLLAFAAKLTQGPGEVVQADIDRLRDAGWSDRAVEDAINVASLFSYLNRLVDGFGIKGSAAGFAQAGAMVAQHGYGPVVQMVQDKAAA